jgi:hypothetical protein
MTLLNFGSCRLWFLNLSVKNSREPKNHLEPGRNLVVDWNVIALMKLDLVSPMVGTNYHGFMTGFESRGAHRGKEQLNAMSMRV